MWRNRLLQRCREMARLMIGLPCYENYRRHMQVHHPGKPVMTEAQFFRNRQQARYGGAGSGRCC